MAYDPKDEETKKAIKEAVELAVSEATEGLKNKNSELLGKVKKLQKNSEIDPDDYLALQTELDDTQNKLTKALKEAKTATAEAEKANKGREAESKVVHDLLVDQGLSKALIENGVKNPQFLKASTALLKGKVTLEVDGDKRVAKVGDKVLSDFVKDWAGSDDGKEFVSAAVNSGGGAGGNGSKGGSEDLNKLSPEARLDAINNSGGDKS